MMRADASSHSSLVPLKTPLGEQRAFNRGLNTAVDSSTNRAGYGVVCVSIFTAEMVPVYRCLGHTYMTERDSSKQFESRRRRVVLSGVWCVVSGLFWLIGPDKLRTLNPTAGRQDINSAYRTDRLQKKRGG